MKVVVIGSVNMDYTFYVEEFPKMGETISSSWHITQGGGKGANQAVALARAGADVSFICALGNDGDGKEMEEILSKNNMNLIIKSSSLSTGKAMIVVDKKAENEIIIYPGANYDLDKEYIDSVKSVIQDASYLILQNEIKVEVNAYLIELASSLGVKVIYNPAPYRELDSSLFSKIDYITPNETELHKMTSVLKEGTVEERAAYLRTLGVKNVIVTLGTKGSYYLTEEESGYIPCFKVEAVDTVAAGDTFNGYLVSGLARGKSLKDALLLASKASSITVTRKGAIPSIPYLNEVE